MSPLDPAARGHDTLLLFGATGDLSVRYLFPSLLHLLRDRLLPPGFRIVAVGRQEYDGDGFQLWLEAQMAAEASRNREAMKQLLARTSYLSVDLSDRDAVARALAPYAANPCVSYLAIPPDLFVPTCAGLQAAGVLAAPSRLVLEKPIGHDLQSSREINAALRGFLDESRIFRIDHYLGKAPVQNLLALRFGNTLMEAVWHHRWIASVDILVAETAGVDGREGYYAKYGALRDMVQNHMLQLLALIAMEPPASLAADSLRDEKRKVLRALRPMTAADVNRDSMRGRYQGGVVDGRAVPGFSHDGDVETFVALRAYIDNWRWAGVPFRLVTGKRMAA
ncbi:MAG: glucose-6-phosphate dehydrogenase, partial [Arenimonas sp.]